MSALLLTADLTISSKAAGAAQRVGQPLETAASVAELLAKATASHHRVVILDLSLTELDPVQVVPRLRSLTAPPESIVAFGPHVHEQRLAAAREAGCDRVMSRGQFHAQLDQLLAGTSS